MKLSLNLSAAFLTAASIFFAIQVQASESGKGDAKHQGVALSRKGHSKLVSILDEFMPPVLGNIVEDYFGLVIISDDQDASYVILQGKLANGTSVKSIRCSLENLEETCGNIIKQMNTEELNQLNKHAIKYVVSLQPKPATLLDLYKDYLTRLFATYALLRVAGDAAWEAAQKAAQKVAGDAAKTAAEEAAGETAGIAAEEAAGDAAKGAAQKAALNAAWNAARGAARDAAYSLAYDAALAAAQATREAGGTPEQIGQAAYRAAEPAALAVCVMLAVTVWQRASKAAWDKLAHYTLPAEPYPYFATFSFEITQNSFFAPFWPWLLEVEQRFFYAEMQALDYAQMQALDAEARRKD